MFPITGTSRRGATGSSLSIVNVLWRRPGSVFGVYSRISIVVERPGARRIDSGARRRERQEQLGTGSFSSTSRDDAFRISTVCVADSRYATSPKSIGFGVITSAPPRCGRGQKYAAPPPTRPRTTSTSTTRRMNRCYPSHDRPSAPSVTPAIRRLGPAARRERQRGAGAGGGFVAAPPAAGGAAGASSGASCPIGAGRAMRSPRSDVLAPGRGACERRRGLGDGGRHRRGDGLRTGGRGRDDGLRGTRPTVPSRGPRRPGPVARRETEEGSEDGAPSGKGASRDHRSG